MWSRNTRRPKGSVGKASDLYESKWRKCTSDFDFYKVESKDIIIVYDDVSLEPGQLRIRGKGSAGGHNGIKNIIAHLGTQEFPRVKVGVGEKPKGMDLADYVLSRFSKEEQDTMEEAFHEAANAVAMMVKQDIDSAMNHFNMKKKTEEV